MEDCKRGVKEDKKQWNKIGSQCYEEEKLKLKVTLAKVLKDDDKRVQEITS